MLSKNVRMSASRIQLTFRRLIPTTSASSAWCWLPPRPEAVGETEEVRLVDGVQHLHHRALHDLVLQRGDAERPLPTVGLEDVLPP
jgi:hypothetical protein